jgi:diguanylate cyclase (GGDEF)-like protein
VGDETHRSAVPPTDPTVAALRALHDVTARVHRSLDLATTLDAVAAGVVAATPFQASAVNLVQGDVVETVAVAGPPSVRSLLGSREDRTAVEALLALSEPWGGLRFLSHTVPVDAYVDQYWVPDMPAPESEGGWHPEDSLFASLTTPDGEWIGMLSVDMPLDGRRPGTEVRQVLEIFADHAALAIVHARLHAQLESSRAALEHAATHDELTGLPNRAAMRSQERLTASRSRPVSVHVVDLNGFKAVNDRFGHATGDEVLRTVALRLRDLMRPGDSVARWGGDEFVVVQRNGDPGQMLDRLSAAIRRPVQTSAGVHVVGASVGTATSTRPCTLTALMREADGLMYVDKRAGSDR